MNYRKIILEDFLEVNHGITNVFDGFNMNTFIKKKFNHINEICGICLNICKLPCTPNNCKHYFCNNCLRLWSKIKKICPICRKYYNHIIKY